MNESTRPTSRPARVPSAAGQTAASALGALIAAALAIVTLVVIGLLSWAGVRGLQGVGISGTVGAVVGAVLLGPGTRSARVLGGGTGGVVGAYFALASAELLRAGTAEWAYYGGAYAALFALPAAALVGGLVGLLDSISRSSRIGQEATPAQGPAACQSGEESGATPCG
jgi:hypothetical protein